MTAPRIGKFSTSTLVKWGDNTNFDGYLLVGFSIPTLSATPFPDIRIGNAGSPSERLPGFYKIPIENGVISTSCGLFYNADLVPRTTQYYAWLYTSAGFPVAGPSSAFSVTSDTITVPTFTVGTPAAGSTPTPDSDTNAVIPLQYYRLTGDVDGNGKDITGLDNLTSTTASFSGAVSTGSIFCTSLTSSGTISGTTGAFSSSVSGTTGTFSGVVKIPDGSLAAPGLEFGSDTNTGIYRPTTDNIGLVAGGTEALRVDAASVRYIGSAFKYLDCESDHLAFYKKSGSQRYYWRRSADGTHGGASQFEMASLDEVGNLIIAGFLKANIPAYANNAAAIAGGLVAGQLYHDGTGDVKVVT